MVHTKQQYVTRAVQLITASSSILHRLKRDIAHGLLWLPTFDTSRLTKHIETAYETMWEIRTSTLNSDRRDKNFKNFNNFKNFKNFKNEDMKRSVGKHASSFGKIMNVGTKWDRSHIIVAPRSSKIADEKDLQQFIGLAINQALKLHSEGKYLSEGERASRMEHCR